MSEGDRRTIEFRRRFQWPRVTLFRAFADAEALRVWWAPKGWHTPHVEMDFRVGGAYCFGMQAEGGGDLMYLRGEYREIVVPSRLVFTYIWEGSGAGERWREMGLIEAETLVTLEFIDLGEATELLLRHEGFPTTDGGDAHKAGWSSNWDCLDEFIRRRNTKISIDDEENRITDRTQH